VLTDAIYFKGKWARQFKKAATSPRPFYLTGGDNVQVPMMHQKQDFNYFENNALQVLEMPYDGDHLSMVVFLPKAKNGIGALENSLDTGQVENWLAALREQKVIVALPKFQMTCAFNLKKVLKALGMTDAFDVRRADFSGMTPDPAGLFISDVIHKAFMDVNEEGTEAAAATAVVMTLGTAARPGPVPVFRADHPFVFLIRDKTSGSILFIGRVLDPRQ
jgi:serpin B